jgi:Sulfatase
VTASAGTRIRAAKRRPDWAIPTRWDFTSLLFQLPELSWYQRKMRCMFSRNSKRVMRIPMVMHWPGVIPKGTVVREVGSRLDLLPTIVKAAGTDVPADRTLDGFDVLPLAVSCGAVAA